MKIASLTKRTFLFTSVLFIFLGIVYSCKHQESHPVEQEEIAGVKEWYQSAYPANQETAITSFAAANSSHPGKYDYNRFSPPNWDNMVVYQKGKAQVFEIPIASSNINVGAIRGVGAAGIGRKLVSKSAYVILKDSSGYNAFVMTIIADSAYIAHDKTRIFKNSFKSADNNFSGTIIYTKPDGTFLSAFACKQGKIYPLIHPDTSPIIKTQGLKVNLVDGECDDYYYIIWDNYSGDIVYEQYLGHYCTNGSGDGWPPSGGSTTSTDGGNTNGNDYIANNLLDSCLKKIVEKLRTNLLNTDMGTVIHDVFETNDKVNLVFNSGTVDGVHPGKTLTTKNSVGGVYYYDINVIIDHSVAPDAAQEYWAEVLIHEIMHAYLDFDNEHFKNQLKQHYDMANKYMVGMRAILKDVYPSLTDANANVLLYNGFKDIIGDSLPAYNDYLKQQFGIDDASTTFLFFREGVDNYGTPQCQN